MKFAFVFPGQGSQSAGMMEGFKEIPVVRETFAEASELLKRDLWDMVAAGDARELGQTVNTQPVMLVSGIAVLRAWESMGGMQPSFVAGHSLGEYSALVAAGALKFREAVPLVRLRAEAMQNAVPEGTGAIAAILGLSDEAVREACVQAAQGEVLEAANYNCPGQVVIAGTRAAVERGIAAAKAMGAKKAVMLSMSAPSHCALMGPAALKLKDGLEGLTVAAPRIPVLHNADVRSYDDPARIKDALVRQLSSPVRWVETIQTLAQAGVAYVAECGPGKVLAGLTKRIATGIESLALVDSAALDRARAILT